MQTLTWQLTEVSEIATYVGQPSSMDFNRMVRGHYRREAPNLAELRVLLLDKTAREHQSHAVLSTLVAEVYRDTFIDRQTHYLAAEQVATRLKQRTSCGRG